MSDAGGYGSSGRDRIARLIHDQMQRAAEALVQEYSPSRSFAARDLQNEAVHRILKAQAVPRLSRDDDARAYVYRTMENILKDRWRKRLRERPGEGGEEALASIEAEAGLLMDTLAALVELDRTSDEGLKRCVPAFKAYHFLNYEGRFSREGAGMVADRDSEARTLAEVGSLLGVNPSVAHFRIKKVQRWLQHRLRAYEEGLSREGRRRQDGGPGTSPCGGES